MSSTEVNVVAAVFPDRMTYAEFFEARLDLMRAFCDTAKNYVQISAAGIALPLAFTQTLLGKVSAELGFMILGVPWSLVAAWAALLLAIAFGLAYQWLAIRRLWDTLHDDLRTQENAGEWGFRCTSWVLDFKTLNRSALYGSMVLSFYLGALFFVVFAITLLARS